jgi:hypothetical protein
MKLCVFVRIVGRSVAYNEQAKADFHKGADHWLRKLAKALGYKKGDFDLRHNQGGIAVSGEITLHSDTLYVQFYQSSVGGPCRFLWRTVKGRKDYTGGQNQWGSYEELANLERMAEKMTDAVQAVNRFRLMTELSGKWRTWTTYATQAEALNALANMVANGVNGAVIPESEYDKFCRTHRIA